MRRATRRSTRVRCSTLPALACKASPVRTITGHAGEQTLAALAPFGVDTMFTLNGGHVWPFYEAALHSDVRIVDTRHEQTATFAAEGYAKLTRTPGLAVLTAGPGITNGVSAITTAWFNGSPLVVLGGRAPQGRWGSGSLQELDHVPIVSSITKRAVTVADASKAGLMVHEAATVGAHAAPRARVPRLPARRLRARRGRAARSGDGRRRRTRSRVGGRGRRADRRGRAAGVHRRQRRLLGRCVGGAGAGGRGAARSLLLQRSRPGLPAGRPRAGLPAHPRVVEEGSRPRRGDRHTARLPPGIRTVRLGPRGPRRRLGRSAGRPRRRADGGRRHQRRAQRAGRARS